MSRRKWSEEAKIAAVQKYQAGGKIKVLADEYGVSALTFLGWTKTYKYFSEESIAQGQKPLLNVVVPIKGKARNKYTEDDKIMILAEYEEAKLSLAEIAEKYDISTTTVYIWRDKIGPKILEKYGLISSEDSKGWGWTIKGKNIVRLKEAEIAELRATIVLQNDVIRSLRQKIELYENRKVTK